MVIPARAYGAYGAFGMQAAAVNARTAYTGEAYDATTGWYLLGDRPFSPALRRFLAPDSVSPFDRGGVNRYAYCGGDPVNRIDPSGQTWMGWLGPALGITATSGAARSMTPAPRMQASATTPATMASTAASVADAVSVTAAIDSVASMTSGQQKAGGIFGWVGVGADVASMGVHLAAPRQGSPADRFLGQNDAFTRNPRTGAKPKTNVQLVTGANIPMNRLRTDRSGKPVLKKHWATNSPPANPRSSILAADTTITWMSFKSVFRSLVAKGVSEVNIYTGAHGQPLGNNWHLRTGERLDAEPRFFLQDIVHTKGAAKEAGLKIKTFNMALMTKHAMREHLLKDGVHVVGSCFGIADEVVMDVLNVTQATVYDLYAQTP